MTVDRSLVLQKKKSTQHTAVKIIKTNRRPSLNEFLFKAGNASGTIRENKFMVKHIIIPDTQLSR